MANFNVKMDVREVERMLRGVEKKAVPVAASRALNKTIKSVETAIVRHLSDDIGITRSEARKNLKIIRSNRTHLISAVECKGRRIPLYQLKARQTGKRTSTRGAGGKFGAAKKGRGRGGGVSYRGQDGKREFIPGGFIATMKNGHTGVFTRKPGTRMENKKKEQIDEKESVSAPYVFVKAAAMKVMSAVASEQWSKIFEHELQYELSKYRG